MIVGQEGQRIETANTPFWLELIPIDWIRLRFSSVYYGIGVHRGHDEGVLVIPGHFANDLYLLELMLWLRWIGYNAQPSGIAWNNKCPDVLSDQMALRAEQLFKPGVPVSFVGHSLGGLQATAAAKRLESRRPGSVAAVISLSSPQRRRIRVHPIVYTTIRSTQRQIASQGGRPGCYGANCGCSFADDAQNKIGSIDYVSIYSKNDGVVVPEDCRLEESDNQTNCPVNAQSHIGIAFNAQAYREIEKFLHRAYTKRHMATA